MFGIDGPEFVVILIVLIVVVGPKDLPKMLKAFGKATSRMRATANEFRRQFDDAMREAELDDLQKTISDVTDLDPRNKLTKMFDPIRDVAKDVKASIDVSNTLKQKDDTEQNASENSGLDHGVERRVEAMEAETAQPLEKPDDKKKKLPAPRKRTARIDEADSALPAETVVSSKSKSQTKAVSASNGKTGKTATKATPRVAQQATPKKNRKIQS